MDGLSPAVAAGELFRIAQIFPSSTSLTQSIWGAGANRDAESFLTLPPGPLSDRRENEPASRVRLWLCGARGEPDPSARLSTGVCL
jgi:hypothetical protein